MVLYDTKCTVVSYNMQLQMRKCEMKSPFNWTICWCFTLHIVVSCHTSIL